MPDPKPIKKCEFCQTDPAHYNNILCKDCHDGNKVNLFLVCRKCSTSTALYQQKVDCYLVLTTRMSSGMSKMEDLEFTGSGFLLRVNECPNCSTKKERSSKVEAYWEK